jgi:hypothetical protein
LSKRKRPARYSPDTHIKTTLVLPQDLHREFKAFGATKGRTLTEMLEVAVRAYLENEKRASN